MVAHFSAGAHCHDACMALGVKVQAGLRGVGRPFTGTAAKPVRLVHRRYGNPFPSGAFGLQDLDASNHLEMAPAVTGLGFKPCALARRGNAAVSESASPAPRNVRRSRMVSLIGNRLLTDHSPGTRVGQGAGEWPVGSKSGPELTRLGLRRRGMGSANGWLRVVGSSVPSRSCPPRTPRGAWPASSCWHWR
jgi:hypothetical protein